MMRNIIWGEERCKVVDKNKELKKERERLKKLDTKTNTTNTLIKTIHHFSHPHQLSYLEPNYSTFNCNSCARKGHGKRYHCAQCEFDLHPICAQSDITWLVHHMTLDEVDPNRVHHENIINSFAHPHELVAEYKMESFRCHHCNDSGDGIRMSCNKCDVMLHQVCAKNPIKLASYMHPQHELEFKLSPLVSSRCDLCGQSGGKDTVNNFVYGCKGCGTHLHPKCTQWPLHLAHPFHPPHPLVLKSRGDEFAGPDTCSACKQMISGRYNLYKYNCKICSLDFHLNCILEHSKLGIGEDVKGKYDGYNINVLPVTNLKLLKVWQHDSDAMRWSTRSSMFWSHSSMPSHASLGGLI